MLSQISKTLRARFCVEAGLQKIYDMIYQVKDVTIVRKIDTNSPYFMLDHKKMELPQEELLINFLKRLGPDQPFMQFLDKHMNAYHQTTPLRVICQESFYVYKKGYFYFVMNNLPLVDYSENKEFNSNITSEVVEAVCRQSLDELPENPKQLVSGRAMHNLLVSNLLQHGMQFKVQKIRYKQLLKIVDRRIQSFEDEIREVYVKVEKKSSKMVRRFTNFMLMQYGLVHYLIYFRYSWDILEPITCILGNCDLLFAYYFFIVKGRDWSLGEMHSRYFEDRKFTNLRKYGVDVDKYQEMLEIKEYLEFRLALLSKSPNKLYRRLTKPIKLLNTH